MREDRRSACPINLALEVFGDRWSLLIIRDMVFAGKRHFREFLASDEKISTRILSDRLASLVSKGVLTKTDDPDHKQKAIYSLTEKGIALLSRHQRECGRCRSPEEGWPGPLETDDDRIAASAFESRSVSGFAVKVRIDLCIALLRVRRHCRDGTPALMKVIATSCGNGFGSDHSGSVIGPKGA